MLIIFIKLTSSTFPAAYALHIGRNNLEGHGSCKEVTPGMVLDSQTDIAWVAVLPVETIIAEEGLYDNEVSYVAN